MSAHIASFDIQSPATDEVRRVDLIEGVDEGHIAFVEREWQPLLDRARARAILALRALPGDQQNRESWTIKQATFGAPDAHWKWRRKNDDQVPAANRMFALCDGASVEGLMRIDLTLACKLQSGNVPMVYVEYLAVAPWNRPPIQSPPRFKGLGKILLGVAVSVSLEEEMAGRCGLHSLPQSEGFYVKAGMTDLGPDNAVENLRYFEFSPSAAQQFLEE